MRLLSLLPSSCPSYYLNKLPSDLALSSLQQYYDQLLATLYLSIFSSERKFMQFLNDLFISHGNSPACQHCTLKGREKKTILFQLSTVWIQIENTQLFIIQGTALLLLLLNQSRGITVLLQMGYVVTIKHYMSQKLFIANKLR